MRYISDLKNKGEKLAYAAVASGAVLASASCQVKVPDADNESVELEETQFHADNDIAMTVSAIVDAIRVGENLTPADYNFDGVLTDGQGTPLYTDVEGSPGEWRVEVVGDDCAKISNCYIGDLMPDDLRTYILGSLNLNGADLVSEYWNPENEDEYIYHYDTGIVDVNFSTKAATTASGLDGIIMTISVSKK